MVAAAKLRKAQAAAEAARPYAERLSAVMASLAGKVSGDSAPRLLAGTGANQRHLLVVVNTDKGLCGGLNANIVKAAKVKARALIAEGKDVTFYPSARRAALRSSATTPTRSGRISTRARFATPASRKPRRSPTS
jgi:ATP synthase F1 gamma subunit